MREVAHLATMHRPVTGTIQGRAKLLSWLLQVGVAAILFQTLFFKFTGAPESVYIFSKLGLEPWGRIGSGVAELVAAALLPIPATGPPGAPPPPRPVGGGG